MPDFNFSFLSTEMSLQKPSPMPPRPKVVQIPMNVCNEALQDIAGMNRKTFDNLLLSNLIHTVKSLGGGPLEQGRIGCALAKQEAVRKYLKEQHGMVVFSCHLFLLLITLLAGSLIHFLVSKGQSHFVITPGVNGRYLVKLI